MKLFFVLFKFFFVFSSQNLIGRKDWSNLKLFREGIAKGLLEIRFF